MCEWQGNIAVKTLLIDLTIKKSRHRMSHWSQIATDVDNNATGFE